MSISTSTMKTATLIWTTGILGGAVTLSLYHLLRIHNKTRDIPPRQIKSSPSVPATFHKSAAVSIVNPHSHSPVHDTRSISLRLPSRLGDEEILARFIKGFCRFFLHPSPLFKKARSSKLSLLAVFYLIQLVAMSSQLSVISLLQSKKKSPISRPLPTSLFLHTSGHHQHFQHILYHQCMLSSLVLSDW